MSIKFIKEIPLGDDWYLMCNNLDVVLNYTPCIYHQCVGYNKWSLINGNKSCSHCKAVITDDAFARACFFATQRHQVITGFNVQQKDLDYEYRTKMSVQK